MRHAPFCLLSIAGRFWSMSAGAIALASVCGPLVAVGQSVPALPATIPATSAPPASTVSAPSVAGPDVSKEALVFDKLNTRVREEADGTGTRQTTARIRILADAGVKDMAVLTFTYTASSQQVDIAYVRVIKPDGSVVATPDYNIQDLPADVTRQAPMYSDIHQKHVAVRGLGVGDTLEYQTTVRTLKPDVPGQFWLEYTFEKDLIVLDEQLDLDLPAEKAVTVASAELQPTITMANGRKLCHWGSSNLARPDPDAAPKSRKKWKPSVQVTTFTSWQQVGAWYDSLQQGALTVTPAVQARADGLTKGLTSDEDKVRAIFSDVALHIHYVALEFGIGRYQPHAADDVLSNEYGDCKDKHTLLAAMLKAKGIEAWPVLISSNRELDPATPSPAQFDHVITLVPLNGKMIWMDSTEEVAPVTVIAGTLRDKQALAVPARGDAHLERTPADLPFVQSARFNVTGKLSDQGTLTAHLVETWHGDAEMIFRSAFRGVPQSQWKTFIQGMSNSIGFGGEVKDPEVSPVEQIGAPFEFSFDYTREKFGEWDDHRISPPLPPVGWELAPGVKQIKPADDIEIGSPGDQDYAATVQIPSGWQLFPPQSVDLTEDWAEYHSKYTFKDGVFTADRRLVIRKDKVPLTDWDKYLAFRRGIYDDEVRMEPIMNPRAAPSGVRGGSYDPGVNGVLADVLQTTLPLQDVVAILTADPPASGDVLGKAAASARDTLDAVETRTTTLAPSDPHSLYWAKALADAWCVRGWTALAASDLPAAENYLRAAWRLNPDVLNGYLLGRVLEARGEKAAASHQYELAYIASAGSMLASSASQSFDLHQLLSDGYRRTTGKELTATPLNHGGYTGSLQAELDRSSEIHQIVRSTHLTGDAWFVLAFEAGKPAKISFLSGGKEFSSLISILQAHTFAPELPPGSKALLLREVRIACSPWAGCDAYLKLASDIRMPSQTLPLRAIPGNPGTLPKGPKSVTIEGVRP
jgi:hypothetical protein